MPVQQTFGASDPRTAVSLARKNDVIDYIAETGTWRTRKVVEVHVRDTTHAEFTVCTVTGRQHNLVLDINGGTGKQVGKDR